MATPKKKVSRKVSGKKSAGPALVDLSPEELRALPRPREGFEQHAETLFGLYEEHTDELRSRAIDVGEARGHMQTWRALESMEGAAAKQLELVQETRSLHSARAWAAMLEIYAKAQAAARTNREIAAAISGFAKFMQLGPRKKAGGAGSANGAPR